MAEQHLLPKPRLEPLDIEIAAMRADLGRALRQGEDRRLMDLLDVRVTVDGPETPEVAEVAGRLRDMVAAVQREPEVLVVGPQGNRRARRRAAARARGWA